VTGIVVSVITPTRQRIKALGRAMESVRTQTLARVEHIVLGDDCPVLADSTVRDTLARRYPAARIENLPASASGPLYRPARTARVRNYGIGIANGRFIAHLDDDNAFEPDHLASLLQTLEDDAEAVAAHSWRLLFGPDGDPFVPPGLNPWIADTDTSRRNYAELADSGVFQPESNLMRGRAYGRHGQPFFLVDTSELMVRADFHRAHRFRTEYSAREMEAGVCEDRAWCMEVAGSGRKLACSGRATLRYTMGGYSNPGNDREAIRNVGFVGAGKHVREVLLPAAVAAGLNPCAVAARTLSSAESAALPYGALALTDAAAVAGHPEVEGVIIAVPPEESAQALSAVIETGKPCYVEKPASTSSAEAGRLAALAEARGCRVHVGYMKRHAPTYARLAEARDRGDMGQLSLLSIRWAMGPFGGRGLADWLTENAVHALDLARYLLGEVQIRHALIERIAGEHVVLAHGTGQQGTPLALQLCTTGPWWHDNETVELFGIGSSLLTRNATELVARRNDGPEEVWRPNFTIPVERNLTGSLLGFTPALKAFAASGDAPVRVADLRDAAATLALVEQLLGTLTGTG
jgi:predicted dehydrogenase